MADKRLTPKALAVAQVDTVTIANTWATADDIVATINEKDLTLVVGTDVTTANVATALKEMINGDTQTGTGDHTFSETGNNVAEFQEVTATVSSSVVTVTGDTKGKPFTLSIVETTAGTGTAVEATATAATGPNHWSNVDNWGGSAIPANTDVVYLDFTDTSLLYGLGQSAVTVAALYIGMSYEGEIGLPEVNADGDAYHEYRTTYLELGTTILQVGVGEGNGSGRIKINGGSVQAAVTVLNTGASADELPAFLWKGTHISNTLVVRGGSVGVAMFGGEAATLSTFTVHGGSLRCGAGVTLSGALTVNDGDVTINSLIDGSLTMVGGQVAIEGTGNVDQLTVRGGTCVFNTNGTLGGNTVISGTGVLDLSRDSRPLAGVTNPIEMYGTECQILDPFKRLGNVVIDFNEGSSPSQVDFGRDLRLTRAATA